MSPPQSDDRHPNRPRVRARGGAPAAAAPSNAPRTRDRFLSLDAYRAEREWKRYEGTPQRDLFRELRFRFLRRHAVAARWVLDVGAGPGRFTPAVGAAGAHRLALDLSREMLRRIPRALPPDREGARDAVDAVVGDALSPPFARAAFGEVALVGNAVGFAGGDWGRMLTAAEALVAPGGTLVVEIAPGPGEYSRYLARLPATAVGRLFMAPPAALVPRIVREGFGAEPPRHRSESFERLDARDLGKRWQDRGWEVLETTAVAPCLGPDPLRIARARAAPRSWAHLLEVEEQIGHQPERWASAAAVMVAARRGLGAHD
jgi:SAM-dependent methyltransferase